MKSWVLGTSEAPWQKIIFSLFLTTIRSTHILHENRDRKLVHREIGLFPNPSEIKWLTNLSSFKTKVFSVYSGNKKYLEEKILNWINKPIFLHRLEKIKERKKTVRCWWCYFLRFSWSHSPAKLLFSRSTRGVPLLSLVLPRSYSSICFSSSQLSCPHPQLHLCISHLPTERDKSI